MSDPSYYEVLGIAQDASAEEVKQAYRREAMKWHPDRLPPGADRTEHEARFKLLARAYRILKDPVLRSQYDEQLRQSASSRNSRGGASPDSAAGGYRRAGSGQTRAEDDPDPSATAYDWGKASPNEDADRVFFETMLDMAFEMATRGFEATKIAAALVALGCPPRMAQEVSQLATSRADPGKQSSRDPRASQFDGELKDFSGDIDSLPWEQARRLYRAIIEGKPTGPSLTPAEFDRLVNRELWVRRIAGGLVIFGAIPAVISMISGSIDSSHSQQMIVMSGASLAGGALIYFAYVLLLLLSSVGRTFLREHRVRHYEEVFHGYHDPEIRLSTWNRICAPGLVGSFLFLAYRKMLWPTCMALLLVSGVPLALLYLVGRTNLDLALSVSSFVGAVAAPLVLLITGNRIYYDHARRVVNRWLASPVKSRSGGSLRRQGGTSVLAAFSALVVVVIFSVPFATAVERRDALARAEAVRQAEAAEATRAAAAFAAAERAAAEQRAAQERQRVAQVNEERRYRSYLTFVEQRYPFLNPDSASNDPRAVEWVASRMRAHQQSGQLPADALALAVTEMEEVMQRQRATTRQAAPQSPPRAAADSSGAMSPRDVVCSTWPSACR